MVGVGCFAGRHASPTSLYVKYTNWKMFLYHRPQNMTKRKLETLETELGNNRSSVRVKVSPPRMTQWVKCVFTLNNYTQDDIKNFIGSSGDEVPKLCFQQEEEACPHLQGFCVFNKKRRPVQYWEPILGHARTHFEKMKGSLTQNVNYCTDLEKRIPDGFVYTRGCPKPTVLMTRELCWPIQLEIADKYIKDEDPLFGRQLHWYYEEKGNWGKSQTATYMIDQMGATEVSGCKKDITLGICKLIEKQGQCPPIVLVDIPRDGAGYVSYGGLEKIKDGKFFSEKYESGMCRFNRPHIICFANEPPCYDKMSLDRWVVFNVDESATIPLPEHVPWSLD